MICSSVKNLLNSTLLLICVLSVSLCFVESMQLIRNTNDEETCAICLRTNLRDDLYDIFIGRMGVPIRKCADACSPKLMSQYRSGICSSYCNQVGFDTLKNIVFTNRTIADFCVTLNQCIPVVASCDAYIERCASIKQIELLSVYPFVSSFTLDVSKSIGISQIEVVIKDKTGDKYAYKYYHGIESGTYNVTIPVTVIVTPQPGEHLMIVTLTQYLKGKSTSVSFSRMVKM